MAWTDDLSSFGGRSLGPVTTMEVTARLTALGVSDIEQLVALLAHEPARTIVAKLCDIADIDAFDAALRAQLPASRLQVVTSLPEQIGGLGALEPKPADHARIRQIPRLQSSAALPPNANLAGEMLPVVNQGLRGTCVAFAMTAMNEQKTLLTDGGFLPPPLSQEYLYYRMKLVDQDGQCGTWLHTAAQVLSTYGECTNAKWPYDPALPCNKVEQPPAGADAEALGFKLEPVALQPTDIQGIKAVIAGGSGGGITVPGATAVIAFRVYDSWYKSGETARSGRITLPLPGEAPDGGHAVCLVGYQDDASTPGGGYFILRNSWSTGWGYSCPYGAGYGTMPYQYLLSDCTEAYTFAIHVHPFTRPARPGGRPTLVIDSQGRYDLVIR